MKRALVLGARGCRGRDQAQAAERGGDGQRGGSNSQVKSHEDPPTPYSGMRADRARKARRAPAGTVLTDVRTPTNATRPSPAARRSSSPRR